MTVHVAVAVIVNNDREVLIALRQAHQHQGGFWEFPGGKVEQSETVFDALKRETAEELDLKITKASSLLQVSHQYADKAVLLDVWMVTEFDGQAKGREGQPLRWCAIDALQVDDFPAANVAIIKALQEKFLHS
ncbi:MAG: 8-oxo-dGTP diphosphatase MutT [Gammaproteobacteria bacterium]|nr:8-oxo-dGTP diphosphatase MutT [Gammaproteobacteria bacterium]MDH5591239.1 8-oxo-dGTP diphosphatase MutT [Gammaproteobacteria bacterium]